MASHINHAAVVITVSIFVLSHSSEGSEFGGDCLVYRNKPGIRCPPSPSDSKGNCIQRFSICDTARACSDGLDEARCEGCPVYQFRCSSGTCVPTQKVCDHNDDCGDGSDEMCEGYLIPVTTTTAIIEVHGIHNSTVTTLEKHFGGDCAPVGGTTGIRCPPSLGDVHGMCLRRDYICTNGVKQCPDGFDEKNCDGCPRNSFRCNDGSCVSTSRVCDHFEDCEDGSDEMCDGYLINPTPNRTTAEEKISTRGFHFGEKCTFTTRGSIYHGVRCPSSLEDTEARCIRHQWICNGAEECPDGYDEVRCGGCPVQKFRCRNGRCIKNVHVCDGKDDCGDKSDEMCGKHFGGKCIQQGGRKGILCPHSPGSSEGTCIHREFICDRDQDCPGGFDEKGCDGCPKKEFRCSNGRCVDATKVCDHSDDCGDNSDEMCEGYFIPIRTTTTTTTSPPRVNTVCRDLPVPIGGAVTYLQPQSSPAANASISRTTQVNEAVGAGFRAIGTQAVFRCVSRYYSMVGSRARRCQDHGEWSGRAPVCNPECGQSDEARLSFVVGGKTSSLGQWPWQVAISRRLAVEDDHLFCNQGWCMICGGSLLSERWVVTAAHCATFEGKNVPMAEDGFRVYLGKHFRDDTKDDELVQVRQVREIHVHENFHPRTFDSDIALMQLDSPVQLNSRTQPVCLPTPMQLFEGKEGVVTGWGDLFGNKTYSSTLQYAVLPVVLHERCRQAYKDAKLRITVTPNMFCAGSKEGQRDACQGDSGGPMVFYNNATSRWVLEGIVSWGGPNGCGVRGQYGGFTTVYKFLEWIHLFF